MLATALGVDGGQHTARIGHEYLATAHDRPHAGRRIVHVLPPRGPLPQLFAVLTAQGVERICPIAEHYHAVFDEWFGLDVAANTAPLPHDSAVANADGSKMMVATAYVGYAAVDGYGAHHGPLGGYFPAWPAPAQVNAVDITVGRPCHNYALADGGRADDAPLGGKLPSLVPVLIEASKASYVVGHHYEALADGRR